MVLYNAEGVLQISNLNSFILLDLLRTLTLSGWSEMFTELKFLFV